MYGLGLLLYELLCGEPAFADATRPPDGPPPPSARAAEAERRRVAGPLDAICARALRAAPADRYPTAQALADDVRRYLRGEPVHARPAGGFERASLWLRRNRWPTAIAVTVLLVLASAAGGAWLGKRRAEQDASRGWGAHAQVLRAVRLLEELSVASGSDRATAIAEAEQAADELAGDERAAEVEALLRLALGRIALTDGRTVDAAAQLQRALGGPLGKRDRTRAAELLARARGQRGQRGQ